MSYNPNMLSEIVSVRPVNGTDVEFMIIDGSRAYAIMLFHARHYDDPDQFDPRDKMVVSREKPGCAQHSPPYVKKARH